MKKLVKKHDMSKTEVKKRIESFIEKAELVAKLIEMKPFKRAYFLGFVLDPAFLKAVFTGLLGSCIYITNQFFARLIRDSDD